MLQSKLEEFSPQLEDFIFKKLLEVTSFGLVIFDENLKIVFWSNSAKKITGYNSSDVIGKKVEDSKILEFFSKKDEKLNFGEFLKKLFDEEKDSIKTIFIRHKNNYRFSITMKLYFFKNTRKMKKYVVGIFNIFDVLDYSRRLVSFIKKASNQDWLTKLPNRKNLEFLINKKVQEFKRYKSKFGIILFDIDNFKSINDCMGHNVGDEILISFSNIISKNLRNCDLVGRWGGDEFVAIIVNVDDLKIKQIMSKLVSTIKKEIFKKNGFNIHLNVSAGFSVINEEDNLNSLIERADKNMYEFKFKKTNP